MSDIIYGKNSFIEALRSDRIKEALVFPSQKSCR